LSISYGYEIQETNDPFVELADQATTQFSVSTAPGAYLVDLIPACNKVVLSFAYNSPIRFPVRHIPSWFPGAGFQTTAKAWASTLNNMVDQPYQFVKQQMVRIPNIQT
jgi:hypothetical protein